MTFAKSLVLVLALGLTVGRVGPARADDLTPDKRANIEALLEMTGALALGRQMSGAVVQQLTDAIRRSRPDVPQRALEALPGVIDELIVESMPALQDMLVPLYHRHFTAEEIAQLIDFYRSALGRKTIQVMPQLLQESMVLGRRWGESLGPEIQRRVRARLEDEGVRL